MLIGNRKLFLVVALAFVGITFASYFIFDSYIRSTAKAVIQGWLETEALDLQQGNYLSAVTKSQRIIFSSDIIQGVSLVRILDGTGVELIKIGSASSSGVWSCPSENINTSLSGFFTYEFTHCFSGSENQSFMVRFVSKNSTLKWIFLASVMMIIFGFGFFVFAILFIQKQESDSKIRILESFMEIARQVAHDIRSPLSALTIASSKIGGYSSETEMIGHASKRITEIANDLLEKTRELNSKEQKGIEGRRNHSRFGVLGSIAGILQEKRFSTSIAVKPDLQVAESVVVEGDVKEFQRAISNLINNSIEALGGRGDGEITVGVRQYQDVVQIIIADNGPGIPKALLGSIGQKGFTAGKKSGNGLGIYHAKKFTEDLGGTFNIQSQEDAGTIVTISLKCQNT